MSILFEDMHSHINMINCNNLKNRKDKRVSNRNEGNERYLEFEKLVQLQTL